MAAQMLQGAMSRLRNGRLMGKMEAGPEKCDAVEIFLVLPGLARVEALYTSMKLLFDRLW